MGNIGVRSVVWTWDHSVMQSNHNPTVTSIEKDVPQGTLILVGKRFKFEKQEWISLFLWEVIDCTRYSQHFNV